MGLIACPDCELEIGENANVCPHCGSVIDEKARSIGKVRRRQIMVHGSVAVILCSAGALLGVWLGSLLSLGETAFTVALLVGGAAGFVTGSVQGYRLARGGPLGENKVPGP